MRLVAILVRAESPIGLTAERDRVDQPTFLSRPSEPILDDVEEVAVDDIHGCARRRDRTVWCWGGNQYGALGDGSSVQRRTTPGMVPGLTNVVMIDVGSTGGTCALREGPPGTVWCWGLNVAGQVGDGTRINRSTPVQVNTGAS